MNLYSVQIKKKNEMSQHDSKKIVFESDNMVLIHIWIKQNMKNGEYFKRNSEKPEEWKYEITKKNQNTQQF